MFRQGVGCVRSSDRQGETLSTLVRRSEGCARAYAGWRRVRQPGRSAAQQMQRRRALTQLRLTVVQRGNLLPRPGPGRAAMTYTRGGGLPRRMLPVHYLHCVLHEVQTLVVAWR